MQSFHVKLWTGLGAAVLLSAAGACSGEGGEGAPASASGAGEGGAAASGEGEGGGGSGEGGAPGGGSGEGEGGAAGGEGGSAAGEGGARSAYDAVPAESRAALRLAHLKGFFLAAEAARPVQGDEAAAALAGQGLLEVFDPARAEFSAAGLDESVLRRAAQTGDAGSLRAALAAFDAAQRRASGDPAAVARGLTAVTVGLHRETLTGGGIDPVEYQHAYGAALALRDLARQESALSSARGDIDRLTAMWRSPVAPENPAQAPPVAQVQAQASRIELALSGA